MGRDAADAKGTKQQGRDGAFGIDGGSQKEEDDCSLDDAGHQSLFDVSTLEVSDLMGKDREEFLPAAVFDQVSRADFLCTVEIRLAITTCRQVESSVEHRVCITCGQADPLQDHLLNVVLIY